jgi:hypothetical protein
MTAGLSSVGSAASSLTGSTSGGAGPDVTPGTVASWGLQFYRDNAGDLTGDPLLIVTSDTYDGTVNATLPADLSGGTYEAVVEGLIDDDYAKLRGVTDRKLAVTLHLWWKDAAGLLGDLANFTGLNDPLGMTSPKPPDHSLVAVLRVDRMSRRAGPRRYETVFTMTERVWARLGEVNVQGACYPTMSAAIKALADAAGITITPHLELAWKSDAASPGSSAASPGSSAASPDSVAASPGSDVPTWANVNPGTARNALTASKDGILDQLGKGLKIYGLHPVLLRDGVLHAGTWTNLKLPIRSLNTHKGLLSTQRANDKDADPRAGVAKDGGSSASGPTAAAPAPGAATGSSAAPAPAAATGSSAAGSSTRPTVTFVALGRPDIKPGEKLDAPLPPEDFPTLGSGFGSALLTSLTGVVPGASDDEPPPTRTLVTGVKHSISRRTGFTTTVTAVVLKNNDDQGLDKPVDKPTDDAKTNKDRGTVPADPATAAAQAVRDVAAGRAAQTASRVAQIRTHPGSDGSTAAPHHTSTVWYSTVAPDGNPALAQRISITEDNHGESKEVPYLTPFAWGYYGLALPRYPGTRVLLVPGPGGTNDYVDVGALWSRGDGPKSKPGDYWLVLPIGLTDREDIGDDTGQANDAPATHDLIDGDGVRIVETKQFVIRVTDDPTTASGRPPTGDAPARGVLIETKSTAHPGDPAQILLADDGTITIKGTSITFDTAGKGDITLKANNVNVSVSGTMDVS